MRILISGTHFTPAVATIEQLKKFNNTNIVYVGRKTTLEGDKAPSVESRVLPQLGVKFIGLVAGRLQRSFTLYTIPSLLKIPVGFLQAFYIILTQKPDVILSFGGYVGLPVVIVGWFFSVPIILHEQTLSFGLANKISSLFADKIAVSFDTMKGKKIVLTGNPVRSKILQNSLGSDNAHLLSGQRNILVIGGNQGSHAINMAVKGCFQELLKLGNVYHQTGDSKYHDYEELEKLKHEGKFSKEHSYVVKKWFGEDYGQVLQKADLVISRAGINSLSELAALGKPALLIPLFGREQQLNAQFFEKIGLAKILPQSKLTSSALLAAVKLMLNDIGNLKEKSKAAQNVIIKDAGKRLALETVLLGRINP